eukprot:1011781-Pelagomonas_calceolata.AAC.1
MCACILAACAAAWLMTRGTSVIDPLCVVKVRKWGNWPPQGKRAQGKRDDAAHSLLPRQFGCLTRWTVPARHKGPFIFLKRVSSEEIIILSQPHRLSANQQHVHLIEIKYCKATRPGQQLEAAQQQHADLCKNISGKAVTLHTGLQIHAVFEKSDRLNGSVT